MDATTLTDQELEEHLDESDADAANAMCPHCDGALHGATAHCWCAGCEACTRARQVVVPSAEEIARFAALEAEWDRRHGAEIAEALAPTYEPF